MYNFRGCIQVGGRELGLGSLGVHVKMGGEGTKDTTSPHPQRLASPQGISAGLSEAKGRYGVSQPLPFPMGAHRPFPSSCVKPAPSPTTSPSSWGPAALGSTPSSMKVLLHLAVLVWTPAVGSLSYHILSPGKGPSTQEVSPSLPGHHREALLPAFLQVGWGVPGKPLQRPLRQTPAHPERKGAQGGGGGTTEQPKHRALQWGYV